MKVVLCNKYFFLNGGTEKYLYDILQQLTVMGHDPVPFSVKYAGSWDSPYSKYFLNAPSSPDQVRLRDIDLTPTNWLRFLDRAVYSFEARRYLSRLLKEIGGADLAYVLNIYNYMSPSIIHTFRKERIPVVMQIGDYNLLCPNHDFLRDGRPCTLCIHGNYLHGLWHRCLNKNFSATAVRVAAMYVHKWLDLYQAVDAFVVPCNFMKSMLMEGGFPSERIHLLTYPVPKERVGGSVHKKDYILYFGRISYEKGLDTLIHAYQKLSHPVDLVFIGRSIDGEMERLQNLITTAHTHRIRFPGFKTGKELSSLISEALLSVVPSRWYDNAPISIYESMLYGTPVVASRIGGITEQIQDGVNGKLFTPDSEDELLEALDWMLSDRERLRAMGEAGQEVVTRNHSLEGHTEKLVELFARVIDQSHEDRSCK